MDKKYLGNRFQVQNTTQAPENVRRADVGRYGRGRGGPRRENTAKYDNHRPLSSQKSKAFPDKRPKSKGLDFDRAKEEFGDDDYRFHQTERPRKINFNHLLNFSYAPRGNNNLGMGHRTHPNRVKFNKEQFLQANCQFVVKCNFDYSSHYDDPDTLVNWDLIELINMCASEPPSCPICLYPPTAAKITRCGHIYCWPCILHYLSLDDKPWRKCPICYEAVHREHLKSVKMRAVRDYHVGDQITMRLMKKLKGSTWISRVERADMAFDAGSPPQDTCSTHDESEDWVLDKLVLYTPTEVRELVILPEREALEMLLKSGPEASEECFIEAALTLLTEREQCLQSSDQQSCTATLSPDITSNSDVMSHGDKKWFYFYQACDGQQIFLHSVNAHCLMSDYGSLEKGPLTITAEVVEVEHHVMTKELRRRLKYLNHLPVTCEFRTVELHLLPPLISEQTLSLFRGELDRRQRLRQQRRRDESRHRRKVQRNEDMRRGVYPAMKVHIDSRKQFPEYTSVLLPDDNCSGRSSPASVATTNSSPTTPYGSPQLNTLEAYQCDGQDTIDGNEKDEVCAWGAIGQSGSSSLSPSGPSFAEMLKDGKPKCSQWPTVVTNPPPVVPNYPITPNSDPEDAAAPVPSFQASFGDAFQVALENFTLNDAPTGRRKKKSKKHVLFTTGLNRSLGY